MAVKSKIHTAEEVSKLRYCYHKQKMSTVDIEKNSKNIFGKYISRGTIYKSLIKHKITIRGKSESISRAVSSLNIDIKMETKHISEWIDGLMLGDGGINFKKNKQYLGSRYYIGTSSKQWAIYSMKDLDIYNPSEPKVYQKIDKKHPNLIWASSTKTHPDIIKQAKRWYFGKNESKVVPKDVKITPISVMLWYLGDGSLTYNKKINAPQLRLATCSFSNKEINLLRSKLEKNNIKSTIYKSKMDIHIRSMSIKYFFNFIGWKSPFSDYDYKFNIPEWLKLYRLSEIVDNDKDKWKVQYWCKTGKVNFSKSPNGKFFLFDRGQRDVIKNKLI